MKDFRYIKELMFLNRWDSEISENAIITRLREENYTFILEYYRDNSWKIEMAQSNRQRNFFGNGYSVFMILITEIKSLIRREKYYILDYLWKATEERREVNRKTIRKIRWENHVRSIYERLIKRREPIKDWNIMLELLEKCVYSFYTDLSIMGSHATRIPGTEIKIVHKNMFGSFIFRCLMYQDNEIYNYTWYINTYDDGRHKILKGTDYAVFLALTIDIIYEQGKFIRYLLQKEATELIIEMEDLLTLETQSQQNIDSIVDRLGI